MLESTLIFFVMTADIYTKFVINRKCYMVKFMSHTIYHCVLQV